MQSNNSEAQVTQEGQAIAINNITCNQLVELFSNMLGPNGSVKALVNGGSKLNLTKDGLTICKEVPFTHPTAIVITRAANSLAESTGDGITTFILMTSNIFIESFKFYLEGTSISTIINSLQLSLNDINGFLRSQIIPLTDDSLKKLIYSCLSTKIHHPEFLVDIVLKSVINISATKTFDINMVEILKMEGGNLRESEFINGLVLDHAGRNPNMPKNLEDVCIILTNMSLEYEKPEINSEFYYSNIEQREELANSEREFISKKARAIAAFADQLKLEGKSVLLINEKGIDPFSLQILADSNVLGLRRAKRRNLERISKMCGGKIITQISQLNKESLGFCKKVYVKEINEEKYTFIEGVPMPGACTILIRGNIDYSRICQSIKGTLKSIHLALKTKCCISGGKNLYKNAILFLKEKSKNINSNDISGYKILSNVFEQNIKILLKNEDKNIHQEFTKLIRNEIKEEEIIENVSVIGNVWTNSIYTAISLLMCDEIIKAGKSMKEGNKE